MLLRTEKLKKTFGGLVAVNEIDFSIDAGRIAAIIGPNGSGKTTFFNVVSGILPATGGKIFFNDQDVTRRKAHQMTALGMARTFQNIRLFANLTARDKTLFHHTIMVRYETSRGQLQHLLATLRDRVSAHPSVEKSATLPRIRLVGLGSSSVDIEIFAKVLVPDLASYLEVQEDLILDIMNAVEDYRAGFAIPATITHVAPPSETPGA